jgi:hypothetical protein
MARIRGISRRGVGRIHGILSEKLYEIVGAKNEVMFIVCWIKTDFICLSFKNCNGEMPVGRKVK